MSADVRPMIAHVLFRLDYGGMENGIVNLVNGLPEDEFRHAIIALTEATSFRQRIRRADVSVYALHKRAGKDLGAYWRLFKLLRKIKPTAVHTRNVGTMDCTVIAWLAGAPVRIHGEHGWDVHDPDGTNPKYIRLRRLFNHWVTHFMTVSRDLQRYLLERVGIDAAKITHICNGVDTEKFAPREQLPAAELPAERFPAGCVVIGSTLRFMEIKDPFNLIRAFIALRRQLQSQVDVRLLMVGDGPLRETALKMLRDAQMEKAAWLPGARDDIPALLRAMDIYVLGSKREGISNTLLEAMATGIPLVATATGGNVELIEAGVTGQLVPVGDVQALVDVLMPYLAQSSLRQQQGKAARDRAVREYSLARMMSNYRDMYARLCGLSGVGTAGKLRS